MQSIESTSPSSPSGLELLFFSTSTCGRCKMLAPAVRQLAEAESLAIRYLDAEAEPALTKEHDVHEVPTFVLVADGEPVARLSGVVGPGHLRDMVRDHQS